CPSGASSGTIPITATRAAIREARSGRATTSSSSSSRIPASSCMTSRRIPPRRTTWRPPSTSGRKRCESGWRSGGNRSAPRCPRPIRSRSSRSAPRGTRNSSVAAQLPGPLQGLTEHRKIVLRLDLPVLEVALGEEISQRRAAGLGIQQRLPVARQHDAPEEEALAERPLHPPVAVHLDVVEDLLQAGDVGDRRRADVDPDRDELFVDERDDLRI